MCLEAPWRSYIGVYLHRNVLGNIVLAVTYAIAHNEHMWKGSHCSGGGGAMMWFCREVTIHNNVENVAK